MRLRPVRPFPFRIGGIALGVALLLSAPFGALAHDIPPSVTVVAFVKPDGRTLHVVLRVPLESMRDVDFPLDANGFLDVQRVRPLLANAATSLIADYLTFYEGGAALAAPHVAAARISLPSDRSFTEYASARALLSSAPLDSAIDLPWRQANLDVAFDYAITSDRSAFSVQPQLAHLGIRTTTVLRFLPPDGAERAYSYPGNPGLVALDPQWHQAALRFVQLGFTHILSGVDHLLFLLCLVIPLRRARALIIVATSFTLAHSVTLAASALGFAPDALWFPPLIEVLVALSIVYMAIENMVGARTDRRWLFAFGFGLVHGFAFSFALRESMQFGGSHLVTSLLAFNAGVEVAQLLVLAIAVAALWVIGKAVKERTIALVVSAVVAHTAWHWLLARGDTLRGYRFTWPLLDAAFAVSAMRALMLTIVAGGILWLLSAFGGRLARGEREREVEAE